MTQADKIAISLEPPREVKYPNPILVVQIDDRTGERDGDTFELPPDTYSTFHNMRDAERLYTGIDDPTAMNRLLMLVDERRGNMPTIERIRELLPQLPIITVTVNIDMVLTNSVTGRRATIHKGRRNFVVARRGDVLWIFWLSGLNQGRLVGLSMPFFTVQFEDLGVATIKTMPDVPIAA